MTWRLTRHAERRLAGRAISEDDLALLFDFCRPVRARGADRYAFDRAAREEIRRTLGKAAYRRIAGRLNVYAVVSDDGAVITAGHRTRRGGCPGKQENSSEFANRINVLHGHRFA